MANNLLQPRTFSGILEPLERPFAFLRVTSVKQTGKAFETVNLGYPLVSFTPSSVAGLAAMVPIFQGVTKGCESSGPLPRDIRGYTILSIDSSILGEAVSDPSLFNDWLGRTIWLTDMPAGDWPTPNNKKLHGYCNTAKRYRDALTNLIRNRLAGSVRDTLIPDPEWLESQEMFLEYLARYESVLPGIRGSGYGLFASLSYGTHHLLDQRNGGPMGYDDLVFEDSYVPPLTLNKILPSMILAFSKFVIDRMVQAVREARLRGRRQENEKLIRSFTEKLGERPHTTRELCRRHNRLLTADCNDALSLMEQDGLVECHYDNWILAGASILQVK